MNNQGWVAFDQWLNATFFRGWADETISARAYRNASQGNKKWQRIERIIDSMFFWQVRHCKASFNMEMNRMHMSPFYRDALKTGDFKNETGV